MKRSPGAAFFLSVLPGLGHVYLGQTNKGLLLILLTATTIQLVSRGAEGFGVVIPFIWLGSALDAYRSAQEMNRILDAGGVPSKHGAFGFERWWGFALVALGVLLALQNFGLIDEDFIFRTWPLALIAMGVYILRQPPAPTPAMPEAPAADLSSERPPEPAAESEPIPVESSLVTGEERE